MPNLFSKYYYPQKKIVANKIQLIVAAATKSSVFILKIIDLFNEITFNVKFVLLID